MKEYNNLTKKELDEILHKAFHDYADEREKLYKLANGGKDLVRGSSMALQLAEELIHITNFTSHVYAYGVKYFDPKPINS